MGIQRIIKPSISTFTYSSTFSQFFFYLLKTSIYITSQKVHTSIRRQSAYNTISISKSRKAPSAKMTKMVCDNVRDDQLLLTSILQITTGQIPEENFNQVDEQPTRLVIPISMESKELMFLLTCEVMLLLKTTEMFNVSGPTSNLL